MTGCEIRLEYARVIAHFVGSSVSDLHAELDDVDAVANTHDQVHVVVDEQASNACSGYLPQLFAKASTLLTVESGSWLIEQQHLGVHR